MKNQLKDKLEMQNIFRILGQLSQIMDSGDPVSYLNSANIDYHGNDFDIMLTYLTAIYEKKWQQEEISL